MSDFDSECRYHVSEEDFKKEINYILHWNYRNLDFFPELLKYRGKHVEDLYLKGNCIEKVPKWIVELEYLSEIHLAENKLKELPEEISQLKSLRVLDISDNEITELWPLTSLSQLNCLNASKNLLTKLPEDIGRLKALSHLYLRQNNLSKIPSSITDCISLREIDLDYNKLTSLPKSMVYMPNLEVISVFQNEILYLPAIPFHRKPVILASGNRNLNHVSQDVDYLRQNGEWSHVKLDESMLQGEMGNLNVSRTLSDYSVIHTENSVLVIPMRVHHEDDTIVPSLQEICFREINKLDRTNGSYSTDGQLIGQLAHNMCKELLFGPTARCQKCHTALFEFAFIRILRDEKRPRLNIVQYFCTTKCLKLFKNCNAILWPEIRWKHATDES